MTNFHIFEAGQILSQFNRYTSSIDFPFILNAVINVLIVFFILYLVRKLWIFKTFLQQESVFLELTPPASTEKTAYTTQQLFSVIHSLGIQKTFVDKLLGRKILFSFEIVSTQDKGIRYLMRTRKQDVSNIKRTILSYLPGVEVKVIDEYLPKELKNSQTKIIEFQLTRHFAYPLQKQDMLYEHDPVAYITGMMTKLKPDELISFQLVLSPIKRKETQNLSRMILRNEDILRYLDKLQVPRFLAPIGFLFLLVGKVIQVIGSQLQWTLMELTRDTSRGSAYTHSPYIYQTQPLPNPAKPARVLSSFEEEAIKSVQEKIDQSLFETTIRLLVVVNDKTDQKERLRGFVSSLATFSVPKYQSFKKSYDFPFDITNNLQFFNFKKRLLSLVDNSSPSLLSISEIADLYHFPFSRVTQTENIVKVHSKELPAPLSLKNNSDLDVIFAKNTYGGTETIIGLTKEERLRHMYVIGATGKGKSTMLLSMIAQDLKNGKGVSLVDPHGDLAEAAINCIPEERIKDLIYFNPFDIKYPIGVNLLELTPGLEEDEALLEKEFIAESIISLFRKVFSDAWSSHPHRIEYILRNTIHTAFTLENPTLFTIFELLNNPPFQKKAIQGLQDEHLKNFWKYEFGKAGDYQKVKMVAPVTARIGRFLFSPSAKRILEQEKSTINFDEILDNKKILICNLSKGNIGEDTSEVMGIMILNKIQLAALKRARVAQQARNSFYLYVDEFQNFATPSFVQMLSEARKYGLNLTMAEQSTSQQKDKNLVQIVLANTGTVVTFRSANPQDEELLLPQFRPYVEYGEITNLPSFHFYMKTAAIHPEEPFSGITVPVTVTFDKDKRDRFIRSSRNLYAIEYIAQQKSVKKKNEEEEKKEEQEKTVKGKSGLPT
ncbi:MAG TPA: type IV secretion system DNA-binding domain-containing protein [Methylomirabilota bacterium]|nr:type IV secretion system DNA-binding domain-containing protein [Methylomirabilota bacterium]